LKLTALRSLICVYEYGEGQFALSGITFAIMIEFLNINEISS